jgi:hypothetical protein
MAVLIAAASDNEWDEKQFPPARYILIAHG